MSDLGGKCHAGVCLVDGEGEVETLLWLRTFGSAEEAIDAFERPH